jgi:Zn-dependent metalloprotease
MTSIRSHSAASPAPAAAEPYADGNEIPHNAHKGKLRAMHLTWRDGSLSGFFGAVQRPLSAGPRESRVQAVEAAKQLHMIDGMIRERWNRAGWDDKGGNITVVVNQVAMGGNAYMATNPDGTAEMGIGTKDAKIGFKQSPAYSPTILFHEFVHGIVGSELAHMPAKVEPFLSQREHNAINESIADVISTGMLGTDWKNGGEIRDGAPLRNLADPSVPTWNAAVRRDTGLEEHTLSGIVSRAAVVAAESAGTMPIVDAWYAGIDRFYRTELLSVQTPGAGRALGAWVRATMRGAELVGGPGSDVVEAMRAGWDAVGLGHYATQEQLDSVKPPAAKPPAKHSAPKHHSSAARP